MRKIIFLLLIFLLIAAACNSTSNEKINVLEKQNQELRQQLTLQQQGNDLDLQSKCSDGAEKTFRQFGYDPNKDNASYTSHFNKKLNKCFILIDTSDISKGTITNISGLYDAFENKEFGWFMIIRDKPLAEQKPTACWINPGGNKGETQFCNSEIEFENLIKPYMND